MTYDLDGLRAALENEMNHDGPISAEWGRKCLVAARFGLLDDAALGRAVRAAAERDGPEREAMTSAIAFAPISKCAEHAARALVAMGGGK